MRIVVLALLFIVLLFLITIINSWMRLGKLRTSPRFGSDRWININHLELHFVEFGEGPALLLLPDFWHSYRTWNLLLPHLAPHFRCLALEYPGVGTSDVAGFPFTIPHQTRLLKNFIDHLGLGKVHLLGHGYGGSLVFHLAEQFPSRVARGVVIEGMLYPAAERPVDAGEWLRHLQIPGWGYLYFLLLKTGWLSEQVAKKSLPERWESMSALERYNFQNDIALSLARLRRVATRQLLTNWRAPESESPLPQIERPILHLVGAESTVNESLQPGISWLKQQPSLTHWMVAQGEHDLHWQFPRWVARVTCDFLNELDIFQTSEPGGVWLVEASE